MLASRTTNTTFDTCYSESAIGWALDATGSISNSSISSVKVGPSSSVQVSSSYISNISSLSTTPTCSSNGFWKTVDFDFGSKPICVDPSGQIMMPLSNSSLSNTPILTQISFRVQPGSSGMLVQTSEHTKSNSADLDQVLKPSATSDGVVPSCSSSKPLECSSSWSRSFWVIVVSASVIFAVLLIFGAYAAYIFRRDWMVLEEPLFQVCVESMVGSCVQCSLYVCSAVCTCAVQCE